MNSSIFLCNFRFEFISIFKTCAQMQLMKEKTRKLIWMFNLLFFQLQSIGSSCVQNIRQIAIKSAESHPWMFGGLRICVSQTPTALKWKKIVTKTKPNEFTKRKTPNICDIEVNRQIKRQENDDMKIKTKRSYTVG